MDRLVLIEYTDPYSVWCWGAEPILRKFEFLYEGSVEVRIVLGGLFEDFTPMRQYFNRMTGGHWEVAAHAFLSGVAGSHRMPMNVDAMMKGLEDFQSTWPGCIAAKAGFLQGVPLGRSYLRRLRHAVIVEGRAIHHREVQLALARESGLAMDEFERVLEDGEAESAFQKDLEECRSTGVTGFPTFDLLGGQVKIRLEGFHPWDRFSRALGELAPGLRSVQVEATQATVAGFLGTFGRSATREVAEAFGLPDDDAEVLLEELEAQGKVRRVAGGTGILWDG